jgi:uncharacterized protein (TIGR03083 family)
MTVDHLKHLRRDADAVLGVLARAELTEPVAGCPGWSVRDLALHLGTVHRWATAIVRTGERQAEPPAAGTEDLAAWFADGVDTLLAALSAVDPAAPCWSFTADRTAGFWVRRQALETVVHRWDLEQAAGEPESIDPELAADGVAEVAELLAPRQVRLERIPPLPGALTLRAIDRPGQWVVGTGGPVATVTAPAELLLLLLWHRLDPGDPRLRVAGDRRAAEQVLRLALAP